MIIDESLLNKLSNEAGKDSRLRKNFNLHQSLNDEVQRLLNALEPGTIMPIHRHLDTEETYMLLRGEMNIIFYNDDKQITDTFLLSTAKGNFGIHIPAKQWHSLEVIEKGTVIFEVKKGPYHPFRQEDIMEL